MTTLHSATLSDLATAASWIKTRDECRFWAGSAVPYPIRQGLLAQAIDFTYDNSFSLLDSKVLVGFGQLLPKAQNRGHLARLIVAPEYRGQGYGRALVQALIEAFYASRFTRLSLNVARGNDPAIRLYSSFGFATPASEQKTADYIYLELNA